VPSAIVPEALLVPIAGEATELPTTSTIEVQP